MSVPRAIRRIRRRCIVKEAVVTVLLFTAVALAGAAAAKLFLHSLPEDPAAAGGASETSNGTSGANGGNSRSP